MHENWTALGVEGKVTLGGGGLACNERALNKASFQSRVHSVVCQLSPFVLTDIVGERSWPSGRRSVTSRTIRSGRC